MSGAMDGQIIVPIGFGFAAVAVALFAFRMTAAHKRKASPKARQEVS
jgi:hypothetical protein